MEFTYCAVLVGGLMHLMLDSVIGVVKRSVESLIVQTPLLQWMDFYEAFRSKTASHLYQLFSYQLMGIQTLCQLFCPHTTTKQVSKKLNSYLYILCCFYRHGLDITPSMKVKKSYTIALLIDIHLL